MQVSQKMTPSNSVSCQPSSTGGCHELHQPDFVSFTRICCRFAVNDSTASTPEELNREPQRLGAASRPVKLQRPGEGGRVQSLLRTEATRTKDKDAGARSTQSIKFTGESWNQ